MKQRIFISTILGIIFSLVACYSEDELTPSGNYSTTKFTFPQGNNTWDMEIKNIHDKYGVYLIYKEVTFVDLNRQWQSLGTGSLYSGDSLTNEQAPVYVDFLKNHFFNYIKPGLADKALPVRIYMLDNFRILSSDNPGDDTGGTGGTGTGDDDTGGTGGTGTGDTGTGGTGTDGTGTGGTGTGGTGTGGTGTGGTGTTDPNFIDLKTNGFDYWAISFTSDEMSGMSKESKRIKRNLLFRRFIEEALIKGIITEPKNFKDEVNYGKPYFNRRPDDPNYYMTRGFIDIFKQDYTFDNPPLNSDEYTKPGWEEPDVYPYRDFVSYIRAAMWYSPEEFEQKYPAAKYPLIAKRYNIVVNYMKTTYGIDLQNIATGPQE